MVYSFVYRANMMEALLRQDIRGMGLRPGLEESRTGRLVYPCGCRATLSGCYYIAISQKLIPACAGPPCRVRATVAAEGSIPACAGPLGMALGSRASLWVYPCVCRATKWKRSIPVCVRSANLEFLEFPGLPRTPGDPPLLVRGLQLPGVRPGGGWPLLLLGVLIALLRLEPVVRMALYLRGFLIISCLGGLPALVGACMRACGVPPFLCSGSDSSPAVLADEVGIFVLVFCPVVASVGDQVVLATRCVLEPRVVIVVPEEDGSLDVVMVYGHGRSSFFVCFPGSGAWDGWGSRLLGRKFVDEGEERLDVGRHHAGAVAP